MVKIFETARCPSSRKEDACCELETSTGYKKIVCQACAYVKQVHPVENPGVISNSSVLALGRQNLGARGSGDAFLTEEHGGHGCYLVHDRAKSKVIFDFLPADPEKRRRRIEELKASQSGSLVVKVFEVENLGLTKVVPRPPQKKNCPNF